ncbi:hypothetical protein H6F84_20560 [Microcoleus sp. FACHB-84]|nr:hypothetical protein [Microcoleus sp. FACHB-84]
MSNFAYASQPVETGFFPFSTAVTKYSRKNQVSGLRISPVYVNGRWTI